MSKEIYQEPRVSLNQLCEYSSASSTRRCSIIKNAKDKPVFIVKRYNEAEEFLAHFLASGSDSKILKDGIQSLKKGIYPKEFDKENALSSADALESFYNNGLWLIEFLKAYDLEVSLNERHHKTIINGVKISIRPELMLFDKSTRQRIGFLKFYISKTKPLNSNNGELISCVGKHYFNEELTLDFHSKNCLTLDVFRGELISAPNAHKRKIADIKASCQEIFDRWDRVD